VDRFVASSSTLGEVKNALFNGGPEHFRTTIRKWVQDFGVRSEDLKNLTVSALLAKLIASTDNASLRRLMRESLEFAQRGGVSDAPAGTFLSEQAIEVKS
jgi:hypothetical protein